MADYEFVGHPDTYYPDLGLLVRPGDVYDLERRPADGHWLVREDAPKSLPPVAVAKDVPATPKEDAK